MLKATLRAAMLILSVSILVSCGPPPPHLTPGAAGAPGGPHMSGEVPGPGVARQRHDNNQGQVR